MAVTVSFSPILYFVDDSANTVKTSFSKTFIGGNSSSTYPKVGTEPNYDDLGLDFEQAAYQIASPILIDDTNFALFGDNYVGADVDKIAPLVPTAGYFGTVGSPTVKVGDYILAGEDDQNLQVVGIVKALLGDIGAGPLSIQLEKRPKLSGTNFDSGVDGLPIYYLPKIANSVGFKANQSFYALIRTQTSDALDPAAVNDTFIWLNPAGTDGITSSGNYAKTDYINLKRISIKNDSQLGLSLIDEISVPCTIKRINGFLAASTTELWATVESKPHWCAYEINPFGTISTNLDKRSFYKLQISENLQGVVLGGTYVSNSYAASGAI